MSDHTTIDDAELKELLEAIHEQYKVLSQIRGDRLRSFSQPYRPGKEWLIEYQKYLQTLPNSIAGKGDCKPTCPGGTCPPCFGWTRSQYDSYLNSLRELARMGSSGT